MSLKRFLLVRVGRLITLPIRRQIRHFEAACEHPERTQLLPNSLAAVQEFVAANARFHTAGSHKDSVA